MALRKVFIIGSNNVDSGKNGFAVHFDCFAQGHIDVDELPFAVNASWLAEIYAIQAGTAGTFRSPCTPVKVSNTCTIISAIRCH